MRSQTEYSLRQRMTLLVATMVLSIIAASAVAAPTRVPVVSVANVESMLATPELDIFKLRAALPHIEDPSLALLVRARIAAAQLDDAQALRLVDRFLADKTGTPQQRTRAWEIATDAAFAAGEYARAAQTAHRLQAALGESHGDAADQAGAVQTETMAAQLAALPAQQVAGYQPHPEAVREDTVGLPRVTVIVNGHPQDAVLDTGANLSVVSLSTARRLGLHLQQGDASVHSASRAAVTVRLGVADVVQFAGLALHNVAFLVLDDKQLAMPVAGGYHIDAIIGFPVLRELQRFRITAAGRLIPSLSGPDPVAARAGNMLMVGNDMYVQAEVGGAAVAMHLDSGGARSSISAAFAQRHPALLKNASSRRVHVGGAGGVVERRILTWNNASVRVGGGAMTLAKLAAGTASGEDGTPNLLGEDVLHAFEWWSVDFGRMRFKVGPSRLKTARNDAPSA